MDTNASRDAHLRNARRRQAQDALAFEQDREAMLVSELEDVLAEAEGARLDAGLFARMSPQDAELVRTALGQEAGPEGDDELDEHDGSAWSLEHGYGAGTSETGEEPAEDTVEDTVGDTVEEEAARLQGEIESSRRVQVALETYLELLATPPVADPSL